VWGSAGNRVGLGGSMWLQDNIGQWVKMEDGKSNCHAYIDFVSHEQAITSRLHNLHCCKFLALEIFLPSGYCFFFHSFMWLFVS
jgi:hypothetical protein